MGLSIRLPAIRRIEEALEIAIDYGAVDGEHQKAWVIDQMVRALTGRRYEKFITNLRNGEDGPDTYEWSEGIQP